MDRLATSRMNFTGKLIAGETYTLHEENAPEGYAYAEDITFTVEKNGTVTVDGKDVNGTVVMKDDVAKVTISKQDLTSGEEVPGATLQILDQNGKVCRRMDIHRSAAYRTGKADCRGNLHLEGNQCTGWLWFMRKKSPSP